MGKIVDKQTFKSKIRPKLKKENKTIALCHGVFDLVHPGHIIHLEQAKQMADVLVVSITKSEFVRKGPGRPYFNDAMRMKVLESISYVDYVMLSEGYTVDDIVEYVEPDIYVKGEEYSKEGGDLTGKISEERELVEKHGGCLKYTTGKVFSSTKLINVALAGLSDEVIKYMVKFKKRWSMQDILLYIEKIKKLKVLVVGDVIVDKYTFCHIQGLMNNEMGYSAKLDYSEEYLGGAAAIAKHLSGFTDKVTLMSIIGNDNIERQHLFDEISKEVQLDLSYSSIFPTIIKHCYLTKDAKREEYRKIFTINNIPEHTEYEKTSRNVFLEKLSKKIEDYDVVFLCDFGHGLIDETTKELIQKKAKYLVLKCETNSTNKGMNIITKYNRADAFVLEQEDIKLAFPKYYSSDEDFQLQKLSESLNGKGWLTRGSLGAYGVENGKIYECPAFTLIVKDMLGAGDAFFSLAGLYGAVGAPIELGTFMGNIGGALDANIVGNREAIDRVNTLKYASTLMNV